MLMLLLFSCNSSQPTQSQQIPSTEATTQNPKILQPNSSLPADPQVEDL